MPSSEDYAKQLIEEANRTLAPHRIGLEEALSGLRNHFLVSLDQIAPRILSAMSLDLPMAGQVIAEAIREVEGRAQADMSRIADFGRDLRRQETQEDILSLLLETARSFAPRTVLFVQRGERCVAWSSRGFSNKAAADLQEKSIENSASPALQLVARTLSPIAIQDTSEEAALSACLGQEAGLPWHIIPMKAMNRVVAVLLTASAADASADVNALRILVDISALYIETLALRVLHEVDAAEIPYVRPQEGAVPAAEPSAASGATAALAAPLPESPAIPAAAPAIAPVTALLKPEPEPVPPVAVGPELRPAISYEPPRAEISWPAIPPEPALERVAPAPAQEPEGAPIEEAAAKVEVPETVPEPVPIREIELEIPMLDSMPVAESGIALEDALKEFVGESSVEVAEAPILPETTVEVALIEPAVQAAEPESPPPIPLEVALEEVAILETPPVAIPEETLEQAAAPPAIQLPEPVAAAPIAPEREEVSAQPVTPVAATLPAPIPEPLRMRTEAEIEIDNLLEAIGRPAPSAGKVEIDLSKEPPPTPIRIPAPDRTGRAQAVRGRKNARGCPEVRAPPGFRNQALQRAAPG